MKRPSFIQGVVVAVVYGFFASALVIALGPLIGIGVALQWVIPALGLAYLLYLLSRSEERKGRITVLSLWAVFALSAWWIGLSLPVYFLVHVGAIWLVRSLYFYSGALPAVIDSCVSALSILATLWAINQTGSVFLATWCFFLVQALFVAIPPAIKQRPAMHINGAVDNEKFTYAKRNAEKALHQMFTQ